MDVVIGPELRDIVLMASASQLVAQVATVVPDVWEENPVMNSGRG